MSESVLVLGGGLAGLQAAVELADAGIAVTVVERGPVIGGKRAAWLTGESDLEPRLKAIADNAAVELLTLTELESLSGEQGSFQARVRQRPRYVNDDCTRCNHCAPVCPEAVPNEYDAGLTARKAIHSPFPQTIPDIYAIDIDSCLNMPPNYLPCQRCVEVCDDKAIHFDIVTPEPEEREVAAVIVATGYVDDSEAEHDSLAEFGYGKYQDVLSSVELQRMLEVPGPSGGFAVRPSDEGYPDSILLVLTRVSPGAAWVMGNQIRRLVAQHIERLDVLVLSADRDDPVLEPTRSAAEETGVTLHFGSWVGLDLAAGGGLTPRFASFHGDAGGELEVDMVVLSSEVHPHPEASLLAEKLGLEQDAQGYLQPSKPGVYLAGGVLGTVGIEAGAAQARAVVAEMLQRSAPPAETLEEETASDTQQREWLEGLLFSLIRLGDPNR